MAKLAFIFPGQGSQRVGMGAELCDRYPHVGETYFERAGDLLGVPLQDLCFTGPEDALLCTENQQPAIFLVSVATWAVLHEQGIRPGAVAGHSLGEYSALVAAGAIDFETGIRLTRRRGEEMAAIAARTGGIMAAVLGLAPATVEVACRQASALGVAEVANFNSPLQSVISGEEAAVRRAMELAREGGARKVVELQVSAPFHCSLMAPLAEIFSPVLAAAEVGEAGIPVVANVTAEYEQSAEEIRRRLLEQLASPVRWTASIERLVVDGYDTFVEVGPGKVLTGLMRQIAPSVRALHTADTAALETVLAELAP